MKREFTCWQTEEKHTLGGPQHTCSPPPITPICWKQCLPRTLPHHNVHMCLHVFLHSLCYKRKQHQNTLTCESNNDYSTQRDTFSVCWTYSLINQYSVIKDIIFFLDIIYQNSWDTWFQQWNLRLPSVSFWRPILCTTMAMTKNNTAKRESVMWGKLQEYGVQRQWATCSLCASYVTRVCW